MHPILNPYKAFMNNTSRCFMVWCMVVLTGIASTALAQPSFIINHRVLSVEEGLPTREVLCGIQDKSGFLWFGTGNGVIRYDGELFIPFNTTNSNLRSDRVMSIVTDDDGMLWVLHSSSFTNGSAGKVDVINPLTQYIVPFARKFPNAPFTESQILYITNGDGNVVQIHLTNGDYYYYAKQQFKRGGNIESRGLAGRIYNKCVWVSEAARKAIWLDESGNGSCNYLSLPTGHIIKQQSDTQLIVVQAKSNSWYYLNQRCGLTPVKGIMSEDDSQQALTGDFTLHHSPGCSEIIIHNHKNGIYIFDNKRLTLLVSSAQLSSLENMVLFSFFKDHLGSLWLCTSMGIIQVSVKQNKFGHYLGKAGLQNQAMENQARGIDMDSAGRLYAVQSNSIFLFDTNAHQRNICRNPGGCYAIKVYSNYVLFTSEYLLKIPVTGGRPDSVCQLPGFIEIWAFKDLGNNKYLLGGRSGLMLADAAKDTAIWIKPVPTLKDSVGWAMHFITTRNNETWVLASNGLYRLNANFDIAECFGPSAYDSIHRKPFANLLHGFQDSFGNFWLATGGQGLLHWNRTTGEVRKYTVDNGLSSNVVYRVEQDEKGYLWLSSDYGLMCFDTATAVVKTYTVKDGIANNEFNRVSSYRAADGRMFFGGLEGINAFYPKDFWADTALIAPLQVISFQQYREKLDDLTATLLQQNQIVVNPADKFFIVKFALLDYDKGKRQYAYMIEGVDAGWNYINENSIRISGLPAGNHVLRIRAKNLSGRWNTSELCIPIIVIEPLAQRTWFRLLLVFLIALLIIVFIRYRTYRLTKAKAELEQTVALRTEQLSNLLGEKDILLKEIHHRVKNNLQIIGNLLDLQSNEYTDERTQSAFSEAKARVRSVALIHQNLYRQDDLSVIELHQFVNELIVLIEQIFKQKEKAITISNNIPATYMDVDTAVPLGLILNELLTNSYKYAFTDVETGSISIEMDSPSAGVYQLVYSDSGPGLPAGSTFESATTLGLRMIKRLTIQIMGKVEYMYDKGGRFTIRFKDYKTRKLVK